MKIGLRGFLIAVLTLSALFVTFSVSANAATFVVNTTSDTLDATAGDGICADAAGACSLRAAISEANAFAGADIITLPAGTYTVTIAEASDNNNLNGDFDILSDITINGAGSGSTIVEANAAPGVAIGRVFHVRFTAPSTVAVINDVTVRHGRYASNTFGAGIRVDVGAATLTLNRCVVRDNLNGSSGGGVSVSGATGATLTVNDSTITANGAGSNITGTGANGAGIHINSVATVNITNTTISNNVSNNAIAASATSVFGAGVFIGGGAGATNTITNSTISGNSAALTGAGATGLAFAGGIYNQQATLSLINSSVTNNTAGFHAGIRTLAGTIPATTNITNSTVSGNIANGTEGGGVVNIIGSTATAACLTTITRSTVSGNSVTGAGGVAGGLENSATAGATGTAVMTITNSTISGNTAPNAAGGFNSGSVATVNFNFATIASNTATTTGGGFFQNPTGVTNLKNSIIADNAAPASPDIGGTITSQDYNHVENTSGGTFLVSLGNEKTKAILTNFLPLPNDVTGTDPQLNPLSNNNGATQTHLPSGTSPVVNAIPNGTNDCGTVITVDQRNITRPQATGCDKGAAELVLTSAPATISGRVTTADGRGIANATIMVTGGNLPQPVTVRTSSFGIYSIGDLPSGPIYVVQVSSKRFVFANPTRVVQLSSDVTDVDFTADAF